MSSPLIIVGYFTRQDLIAAMRRLGRVSSAGVVDTLAALTCYRRLDGDPGCDFWLLAQATSAGVRASLADQQGADAARTSTFIEISRMASDGSGQVARLPMGDPILTADNLLTVLLPVPPGREDEWNVWYDEFHMPSVVSSVSGIIAGHRFAPHVSSTTRDYLVVYEFDSPEALDSWRLGETVRSKRDEYQLRWGVRNCRRAFRALDTIY